MALILTRFNPKIFSFISVFSNVVTHTYFLLKLCNHFFKYKYSVFFSVTNDLSDLLKNSYILYMKTTTLHFFHYSLNILVCKVQNRKKKENQDVLIITKAFF